MHDHEMNHWSGKNSIKGVIGKIGKVCIKSVD